MSYTALYRKFRPDNFDEVKGQEHIVTILKNQICSNRVGHAYLFCGTRGTGKTSVAKVFAKAINCANPKDGNPCNECTSCLEIRSQASMNVIEIDAASNNGVDNIRKIVEEVRYSPTNGRYKVYIIDEVHMLSPGAFNALLKTLEEPPSYVVFILATTEAHKIPVTIMSRCQRYDFKRISVETITEHIRMLAQAEHVETEEKALRYIAGKADGALRDAISLLDQCISFCFGQTLTYDRVLDVLGAVDIEIFAKLLRFIYKGSVVECIATLDEVVLTGRDLTQFITDFTWYLRNLLLVKTADGIIEILEISSEQSELLYHEAEICETEVLMRYIRIFSELSNQIRYATQKRIQTELAFIRLCCPETETRDDTLLDRIRRLEELVENGATIRAGIGRNDSGSGEKITETGSEEADLPVITETALTEDLRLVAANWKKILQELPQVLRTVLYGASPTVGPDNSLLILIAHPLDRKLVDSEQHMQALTGAIEKSIGKLVTVRTGDLPADRTKKKDVIDITKLFQGMDNIKFLD